MSDSNGRAVEMPEDDADVPEVDAEVKVDMPTEVDDDVKVDMAEEVDIKDGVDVA